MKPVISYSLAAALSLAAVTLGYAHSGSMDMSKCPMMGMEMKGMDMSKCPMMSSNHAHGAESDGTTHKGAGTVKKVDPAAGTVTLEHGPIKSLDWPAMTMSFGVRDKALLGKLSKDKKIDFEFVKSGSGYVVTSVR